jgi:hypothetical protein
LPSVTNIFIAPDKEPYSDSDNIARTSLAYPLLHCWLFAGYTYRTSTVDKYRALPLHGLCRRSAVSWIHHSWTAGASVDYVHGLRGVPEPESLDHGLHLLSELDYSQEEHPVEHDHPAQDGEVDPLAVPHLHLPEVRQDLAAGEGGGSGTAARLVAGEGEAQELVLVQALVGVLVERDVVHGVAPDGLGQVVGEAEEAAVEHHDALDAGAGDDAHEEVGHGAGHDHHEPLDDHHGREEHQREVGEVAEAALEADQVVGYGARHHGDERQVRRRGHRVGDRERRRAVVPVQPLPPEDLHVLDERREAADGHEGEESGDEIEQGATGLQSTAQHSTAEQGFFFSG